MNTLEAPVVVRDALGPAASTPVGFQVVRARGFLLQVLTREILVRDRVADLLCVVAERLAWGEDARNHPLAGDCVRLAAESLAVQADLVRVARRLVEAWNSATPQRRVDLVALLAEPPAETTIALVELLEAGARGAQPWALLALLRPIEQTLADVVPLALAAGIARDELSGAAELFRGHARRAAELEALLARAAADQPARAATLARDAEQALSKLLVDCADIGQALDRWRHGRVL